MEDKLIKQNIDRLDISDNAIKIAIIISIIMSIITFFALGIAEIAFLRQGH